MVLRGPSRQPGPTGTVTGTYIRVGGPSGTANLPLPGTISFRRGGSGGPVFKDGFEIRRAAVERRIPCLTSLDTAAALLESAATVPDEMEVRTIEEWRAGVPA